MTTTGASEDLRSDPAAPEPGGPGAARWLAPYAVVTGAGLLRLYDLGRPGRIYFDEAHYVPEALAVLNSGIGEATGVHPPLGKWLIAAGMLVFGRNPVGWRAAAAVAGVLTVLVVYAAGRRLFRHAHAAVLAAGLVAVDGLAFTMSRIAMLDAFLALFVAAAFLFLVRARESPQPRWLLLTGVALGCALATKWSAALAVAASVVVATAWFWRAGWRALLTRVAAPLIAVPMLVYALSYTPWFVTFGSAAAAQERCASRTCADDPVSAWVAYQLSMGRELLASPAGHPSSSSAVGWPVLRPPMPMHRTLAETTEQHVIAVGNPVLWWTAVAVAPVLAWRAARRRDGTAAMLLLFAAAFWLPWLSPARPVYFYYMLPAVPFLALMVGAAADGALGRPRLRWLPAVVGAAAVAAFAALYPVLTAASLRPSQVDAILSPFR